MADTARERTLRNYAVLTGMTPLIPVPLVDDLVRSYFRRRLVRALAMARGREISDADVRALVDAPGRGCLAGCLVAFVIYPLKKIFRKIFYFLEWKRAIDTGSETYHFGLLLGYAFDKGWPNGERGPARVRAAIDTVLRHRGTSPIDKAVRDTFTRSKSVLGGVAQTFKQALPKVPLRPEPGDVEQAVASVEREEAPEIADVAGRLEDEMSKVPPEYGADLCRMFDEELAKELSPAPTGPRQV